MRKYIWSKEEDDFLIENYPLLGLKVTVEQLNKKLNKNINLGSAKKRMRELKELYGINYPSRKMPDWSEEENRFVLENYGKLGAQKTSDLLYEKFGIRRTANTINGHMAIFRQNGLADESSRRKKLKFTEEEDNYIINNYSNLGTEETANRINKLFNTNRTFSSISARVNILRKKHNIPISIFDRSCCKESLYFNKWTEKEDAYLLEHYSSEGSKFVKEGLFNEFGITRSEQAITSRAKALRKMGNNCSYGHKEYTKEENDIIIATYPYYGAKETAKKIYDELGIVRPIQSLCSHAAKKLNVSVNKEGLHYVRAEEIGTIKWRNATGMERAQYYIKVRDEHKKGIKGPEDWIPLSRHMFGEDATGKVVIFLDRDTSNINKDNMRCISQSSLTTLISRGFYSENPEITKAGIAWCELANALKEQGIDVKELIRNLEREVNE